MIGRNGERRSGISAQAARHDDDDDSDIDYTADNLREVTLIFRKLLFHDYFPLFQLSAICSDLFFHYIVLLIYDLKVVNSTLKIYPINLHLKTKNKTKYL